MPAWSRTQFLRCPGLELDEQTMSRTNSYHGQSLANGSCGIALPHDGAASAMVRRWDCQLRGGSRHSAPQKTGCQLTEKRIATSSQLPSRQYERCAALAVTVHDFDQSG